MLNRNNYNPDVLSCIANLSSDEVFTPPQLANQILNMLPQKIWGSSKITFLDPACKSGVFLREIAKRLDKGLEKQMPDRRQRVNHIFKNQLYGIAITELTALLSRRSVYCSKTANGKYAVCETFDSPDGNVRFKRSEHTWENGRCVYCGANEKNYERGEELETHAYEFIHAKHPKEIFKMKFDVIIGNPPYQMSDGGFGRSASPIYQLFIQQAKKLNPRYLTMIIPSRWFAGGKGLDEFRAEILNDKRITRLVEFEDSTEVFPGVDIPGGICYFLWDRDHPKEECLVTNVRVDESDTLSRNLSGLPVFVRHGQAISIIEKIQAQGERTMDEQVSSRKPFGLATTVRPMKYGNLRLRWNRGTGAFSSDSVKVGKHLIDKWKVIASRATPGGGRPGRDGRRSVLSSIEVLPPKTICTETYLVVGAFDSEIEAKNLSMYMRSRFFRFLLSQLVVSHDLTKEKYCFVPILNQHVLWTDEKLYKKYGLTADEIAFIESKIRPMPGENETAGKESSAESAAAP